MTVELFTEDDKLRSQTLQNNYDNEMPIFGYVENGLVFDGSIMTIC